ncbi:DNA recombination protein RmuC [Desulfomarina sp.]
MDGFFYFFREMAENLQTLPDSTLLLVPLCVVLFFSLLATLFRLGNLKKELAAGDRKTELAEKKLREAEEEAVRQRIRMAKLITLLKNERKHNVESLDHYFSSLSRQILEERSSQLREQNREQLESVLDPFNRQLESFKREINEIHLNDTRERTSLKKEILQLRDLNRQINEEAVNLTRALKGDTRVQGTWGELVLERVLEQSGLRKGHEYEIQSGFRDHENKLRKPDVIVRLPEGKEVIIDSKVSLIAWEKYVNSDDDAARAAHLKELIKAIRDHIFLLGSKDYGQLEGINSLDFVLMFMPVEAAFTTAYRHSEQVFNDALTQKIIIVSPTTLLATLRTIENIWQSERQSRNSIEIARKAGLMYDKFRGFTEEMEKIGRQLATCRATYDSAMGKLGRGRGNLISHAEQLKEMGVRVKKEIPDSILEKADI